MHDRAVSFSVRYTPGEGLTMPDKPSYLERLPSILAEAKSPKPIPFFRRRDIEALFGLKKRQAINLMHRIGAIRVSSEVAVDQRDLVAWLERAAASPDVLQEAARRDRVVDRIVEWKAETAARSRKIVLPEPAGVPGLPDGVSLTPGLLSIAFTTEQEILEKLFALARLFAANPLFLSEILKR
jgi:hypothetical protein